VKRFLENFHMKNAMSAITAMPPATDMPIMGPVPRPLLSGAGGAVGLEVAAVSDEEEAVFVSVTVIAPVSVIEGGVITVVGSLVGGVV
jgi:hypothetical protein